jgi:fructokinase
MDLNVVGVGEVLWDLLATGPQLGGAPTNFAYHVHALGGQVQMITRVGPDDYGWEVIRRFQKMGLPDIPVQMDLSAPTGFAKVELTGNGLAHFTIQEDVAWDYIEATPEALAAARDASAICFGSLAQRSDVSRRTIQQLVGATPAPALRIFDINLRQQFYSRNVVEQSLALANIVKLNEDELPVLSAMFGLRGTSANQIQQLAQMFTLALVAYTRGAKGSLLYQNEPGTARWSDCASQPVKVIDTVGAGDSFTAALALGLLHKMDLDEINSIANQVARYVCSQPGATPPMPEAFAQRLHASGH